MDPKFFFQLGTSLLLFQAILSKGNYGSFFTPDRNYLPRPPLVPPTDPPCSSSLPEHFSLTFRLFLSMQSTWSDFQSVSLLFERTNARCTRAHKHTNKQSGKLSLAPLLNQPPLELVNRSGIAMCFRLRVPWNGPNTPDFLALHGQFIGYCLSL